MRDLYLKRNQLCEYSLILRNMKFQGDLPREKITELIEEQNEVFKRFKFYDNYLKIGGKLSGGQKICTQKR